MSIVTKKLGMLVAATVIPAGTVSAFAGNSVPDGYLLCNGNSVSRTKYADLFAVIGTLYGAGDGSTTFNLPDFRGMFLRGYLSGTSAEFGVQQAAELQSHSHTITGGQGVLYSDGWVRNSNDGNNGGIDYVDIGVSATGGSETRPVNYAVNYIIKY